MCLKKPTKKSDKELWTLIKDKIQTCNYLFCNHAKKRQVDRNISDIEVLDILENKTKRKRVRNKKKTAILRVFQIGTIVLKV